MAAHALLLNLFAGETDRERVIRLHFIQREISTEASITRVRVLPDCAPVARE